MSIPQIKYIEQSEIDEIAETLVHNRSSLGYKFPFDIENYLYLEFKYHVAPADNIERACRVDSALIVCRKTIRIESNIYFNNPERSNMSLAHECAHLILHKEYIEYVESELIKANRTDEFKRIMAFLPDKQSRYAEWQAFALGTAILVPKKSLREDIIAFLKTQKLEEFPDQVELEKFYRSLATKYQITKNNIIRRVGDAGLAWLLEGRVQESY